MVAQIERGSRSPSIPVLKKLSSLFNITVDELIGNVGGNYEKK